MKDSDGKGITLRSVFAKGLPNDLRFSIRGKKIVLVEARTKWDRNIIVRAFLYLVDTLADFFSDEDLKDVRKVIPIVFTSFVFMKKGWMPRKLQRNFP